MRRRSSIVSIAREFEFGGAFAGREVEAFVGRVTPPGTCSDDFSDDHAGSAGPWEVFARVR